MKLSFTIVATAALVASCTFAAPTPASSKLATRYDGDIIDETNAALKDLGLKKRYDGDIIDETNAASRTLA